MLILALLLAASPRLAVLEFEVAPGARIDRTYFSDLARTAVHRRAPQVFVMTRESTEVLLGAAGMSLADCTGACEVEVGRKLGADYIVSGRIAQIGSWTALTMRLFSTADGRLVETAEARGKSEDELLERADAAMALLVAPLAERLPEAAVQSPPQPWSPKTKGYTALGTGLAFAGASLAFDNLSATSKDAKVTGADFVPVAGYAVAAALATYAIVQLVKQ